MAIKDSETINLIHYLKIGIDDLRDSELTQLLTMLHNKEEQIKKEIGARQTRYA